MDRCKILSIWTLECITSLLYLRVWSYTILSKNIFFYYVYNLERDFERVPQIKHLFPFGCKKNLRSSAIQPDSKKHGKQANYFKYTIGQLLDGTRWVPVELLQVSLYPFLPSRLPLPPPPLAELYKEQKSGWEGGWYAEAEIERRTQERGVFCTRDFPPLRP